MISTITITSLDIAIIVGAAIFLYVVVRLMAAHENRMLAEFDDLDRERVGK